MNKSLRSSLFGQIPGGLGNWYELRRSLTVVAGILFTILLPKRKADDVFDWFAKNRRARFERQPNQDQIIDRMRVVLDGHCSEPEILAASKGYRDWCVENQWARWQASHQSDWQIRTEVVGIEHLNEAFDHGKGAVFWGMSFCGQLFSKIALSRAGVSLTQLSTADHGAWFPLTLLGKLVAGPLNCLPENRYIKERIRIPVDGGNRYLFRISDVLKDNGCIWIAAERSRAKKLVEAAVLGRPARFPVGAPTMALRKDAALLPVYTQRLGRLSYRVTIEEPISFDRNLPRNELIDQAVTQYARRLTARILMGPGDFEWNHLWAQEFASGYHDV
jgi:hypothetical protein